MSTNMTLICIATLLGATITGCIHQSVDLEATTKMDTAAQTELKMAAHHILSSWLVEGIEGVQFLRTSDWKIGERVFLNSTNDKGYLMLLNQDKDPHAVLDYVQVLFASKEEGKWKVYMESLPNLVIPRKKEKGSYTANSLSQLSAAGEQELGRLYARGNRVINDELIDKQLNEELKKNHQRFLSRRTKH